MSRHITSRESIHQWTDAEQTFEWLERAYEEHNPDLIELVREPSFQQLRKRADSGG
jgi:hypothetical protein